MQAEFLLQEADRIEEQRNKEQQRESGTVVRIMGSSSLDVMADSAVSLVARGGITGSVLAV